jgi:hypothetical protein
LFEVTLMTRGKDYETKICESTVIFSYKKT